MRFLAVAAVAAAVAASAAAASYHPVLRLSSVAPLTVRGEHFRPSERLRISAGGVVKRLRVPAAGTFTVTFQEINFDRCADGFAIVALGPTGKAEATLKVRAQPDCPPQP